VPTALPQLQAVAVAVARLAPLLGLSNDLPRLPATRGHARPRIVPRAPSSPRRLSRLFFTSKFPKPARQSAGDRTADVPPTMSFWALALHKRGNSKNDGAAKGRQGAGERAGTSTGGSRSTTGTTVSKVSACRTRRSYNARPLSLLQRAPCFSTARPFFVPSPLRIWLALDSRSLFHPRQLLSLSFPAGAATLPLTSQPGGVLSIGRQIDG